MINTQAVSNTVANIVHAAPTVHTEVAVQGSDVKCETGVNDCKDQHNGQQASCEPTKDCHDGKDGGKHDGYGGKDTDHGQQASCEPAKDCNDNDHGPKHDGYAWGKNDAD